MKKSSVKQAVIDRLPQSWEYILRKEKKLTRFQEIVYDLVVPKKARTRNLTTINCRKISWIYNNRTIYEIINSAMMYHVIPFDNTVREEFKRIQEDINNYENACR